MTDTKQPEDSKNSAKASSSPADESTQEKLAKIAASLDNTPESSKANRSSSSAGDKRSATATKNSTTSTATRNIKPTQKHDNKISKTAIVALLIAIIAIIGVGGVHYFHDLQNKSQSDALAQQLMALNTESEQRINRLISEQKSTFETQINNKLNTITEQHTDRIAQLTTQLDALKQNQPSDWLIHEAEYLIRIASRTIWLEHDTTAAINLLQDADAPIKELNNPEFVPIRQLIREDTVALKLMPTLNTEEVILSLLALSKQIPQLSFAMAKIPDSNEQEQSLELSEDTADWQSNLAKTWQRFLADFITVRRREGNVEPLMSASNQQHLKENLALKLQQAQWAASEEKPLLFTETLADISQWLSEYFDMGHLETAKFYQSIQMLKDETISYDYPSKLSSLGAIRQIIANKSPTSILENEYKENETNSAPQTTISEEQPKESVPEKTLQGNEQQPNQLTPKTQSKPQPKTILEDA